MHASRADCRRLNMTDSMSAPATPALRATDEDDLFLPDLCNAQSILFAVLVTELMCIVLTLVQSSPVAFDWSALGLTSMFVQWIVLSSAGLLCNVRPLMQGMSVLRTTLIGYVVILAITGVYSAIAEWIMLQDEIWSIHNSAAIFRNLLVSGVLIGIAFRYLYLQHQLRRKEQAELNSRIQALQSRIRPHFLFNSMNIIASLISVDPETAEEVVEDLSMLFRASLGDMSDEPVKLSEELDLCEKYIHIESLRLDDRLQVEWDIDVDTELVRIPMLTLQPLLENAIYHGIQPLPEGGTVVVRASVDDGQMRLSVENPVGAGEQAGSHGNRMALDNTRKRLEAIYGPSASVVSRPSATTYLTTVSYPLQQTR
jgi:two-component system sensor histidine kinase AlgZ